MTLRDCEQVELVQMFLSDKLFRAPIWAPDRKVFVMNDLFLRGLIRPRHFTFLDGSRVNGSGYEGWILTPTGSDTAESLLKTDSRFTDDYRNYSTRKSLGMC